MPDAILANVAEAVATALNAATAGTFSQEFEAERSYADWELPLEDAAPADRVLVDVVPVSNSEMELETRGSLLYKPVVEVIVRRRLGPERRNQNGKFSLAEIDALVLFVQEIAEFFVMEEIGSARWSETEPRRWVVPQHLHKYHQFTGIVRLTFEQSKALS